MNIPSVDRRSARDIADAIKNLSGSYTPEWKFDENNPDAGTALALIYADMHYGTVRRLNGTAQKIMFDFFNSINTEMLPAKASEGYVSFGLANNNLDYNAEVKAGTQVSCSGNRNQVIFRTDDDVLVSNSAVRYIYLSDGNNDIIMNLYDSDSEKWGKTELFNLSPEKSIQSHVLRIFHKDIFNNNAEMYAGIKFIKQVNDTDDISELLAKAVGQGRIKVQYYSSDGYTDFERVYAEGDLIKFYKSSNQPDFKINDENFEIRIISYSTELFKEKSFKKIECFSESSNIIPESVFTNETEKNANQLYPFNEKPSQYDEFYIGSDDCFSKKGAYVQVSFYVDFEKFDIDDEQNNQPQIEYKLIMKHSQFRQEEMFDITVDEVVWEYFNGKGWARLFRDNRYSDIFNPANGRKNRVISFICPDDIQMITVNSKESYYIRAKIFRMNNQFKTRGYFISPVLNEISISYCYKDFVLPDKIICCNNTEKEIFYSRDFSSPQSKISFYPFKYLDNKYPEMYLGFNYPPQYGPVRFLFCMQDNVSFETCKLKWSFLTNDGWRILNVFDETENFRKTGTVTLIGNNDFKKEIIFGKSAYWIKISDFQSGYSDRKNRFFPVLENIYNNISYIVNINDMPEEVFSIEPFESHKICDLSADAVYEAEVWVDEISQLNSDETEQLKSSGRAEIVYDVFGIPVKIWVRWQEVDDMKFSLPDDRHFKVDRNSGKVIFGDNIHGRIPPYKNGNTIRIKYSVGGGKSGNVPAGAVKTINQPLGFVTDVFNPLITYGGTDTETAEKAVKRTSAGLRSCNRAVTAFDYETLAMEAERSIIKVKCISNMLPDGTKSFGNIMLVILTEDYDKEKSYFVSVREKVRNYISSKMSSNVYQSGNLHIIQPQFVFYNIKAEICVKSFKNIFDIKSRAEKKINDFLDVNTGNFNGNGWDIGVLPNSVQILNALKSVEGAAFVKNISLTAYINVNSEIYDVDVNNIKGYEFSLVASGKHDIIITVE